jgi:glucan phosphorylase
MLEKLDHRSSVLEELNHFAHDLLWTWEPRIEAAFRALDPERWESTRQNPVLLLSLLGEEGIAKAMESGGVREAFDGARAAYREDYDRRPTIMDATAPLVIG